MYGGEEAFRGEGGTLSMKPPVQTTLSVLSWGVHDGHITQHQSPLTQDTVLGTRQREEISKHISVS
ncbi:unnamed protein product [Leuciscus chuanchicus]